MATPAFDQECFLISPIGDEGSAIRHRADGVRDFIVSPAVAELGLMPVRADDIAQPGQITLQVIEHVLQAKGAVADLTGANANVFYELAIRHTARLPVVLIAHEEDRGRLPFDLAQMRTIFYDHRDLKSAADCREEITKQLREALEKDAVDSPVAASVNLAHLQVGDASEQGIALVLDRLERVGMEIVTTHVAIAQLSDRIEALEPPKKVSADALKQLGQKFAEAEANRKQLIYDIKSALPGADVSVDTREKRVYVVVEGDAPDEVAAFIAHLAANQELSLSISRASHPPGISN